MARRTANLSRRDLIATAAVSTAVAGAGFPLVVRSQGPLSLRFLTIPDPDGWHPHLRLKGDWLVFEITDGVLSGFGEASHSREDERCRQTAAELFALHYADFSVTLENLSRKEREIALLEPDFVTAASLHAAAIFPDAAESLEYAFDKSGTRGKTGETLENGTLYLRDRPGWGVEPV